MVYETMKCRICGEPTTSHWTHCEEHYKCSVCGTRENLITDGDVFCHPCRDAGVEKQIAEFKGDTQYTHEVVCPHCGHVHTDSWEMTEGEGSCAHCDNYFTMSRDVTTTYSTEKSK